MRKRIRKAKRKVVGRRGLEPADLEDTFDHPELEDWMTAGSK